MGKASDRCEEYTFLGTALVQMEKQREESCKVFVAIHSPWDKGRRLDLDLEGPG